MVSRVQQVMERERDADLSGWTGISPAPMQLPRLKGSPRVKGMTQWAHHRGGLKALLFSDVPWVAGDCAAE